MKISVMGTGYVGLVSGTCLAERGHQVTCIDIRSEVVQEINAGRPPIHEIGLDNLLRSARDKGMLSATTDAKTAILDSDVTLICVGTPTVDGRMDMSQIVAAAKEIGSALASKRGYHVVAVKGLCMNPEFLREGRAVEDFRVPDRIVVGATDSMTAEVFLNVYAVFTCPKLVTTPRTAEMIKYVSNSLLATMISFSNEIGNMCSAVPGVDARLVWKGVHLDRRLTPINGQVGGAAGVTEYLWHGLGFGGSCFPKDVAALRSFGRTVGEQTRMLDAVLDINTDQPLRMVALLEKELSLAGKTVAVLGLAFKPGTDDLRESPALPLVAELRKKGAKVLVHDPIAMPHAKKRPEFRDVVFAEDWAEALRKSDACCLVTAWPEYRNIQPTNFQKLMTRALVIDGRGVFEPAAMAAAGVVWRGVGYTPEST